MSFINSNYIREFKNLLTPTKIAYKFNRNPLRPQMLSRVFSEDFEKVERKVIVDPRRKFVRCWSNIFLVACLANLFFDPLFLLIPKIQPDQLCLETRVSSLGVVLTCIRSLTDLFFAFNILVRFRTAYVAPSSRVFGRGELVIDPRKIALRYIRTSFWFDLIAALPFPQVLIWCILPNLKGSATSNFQTSLRFVMFIQYFQRLSIAYPLSIRIAKATGIVYEAAWLGAAYNLFLYLLSSHVMGNCYYLLVVQRVAACWRSVCDASNSSCNYEFFDCNAIGNYPSRDNWIQASNLTTTCDPSNGNYPFGIYIFGVAREVYAAGFLQKYFYSLWFGLRSVSTQGQNLVTSIYIGENIYSTVIVMLGMLNMALLLGNLQMYAQSITANLEEWRLKKCDQEQWMHHRQLPETLIQSVHRYDRYKWVATAGVNEEALLNDLPKGLRKQIKRHLCLNLVRQVPLFGEMDERTLDSICERLNPMLWTDDLFIIREGDLLSEILFIIRGHVDSYTTNGGHAGFFNTCQLGPGDFCGEELLTWALKSKPIRTLPASTRTVKAISEVEAFALGAEDLRFFATQFQTLHSKQLRHTLRFYSQQWRTWAACFIQTAWRRYKRCKQAHELSGSRDSSESFRGTEMSQVMVLQPGAGLREYVAMLMTNIKATRCGPD